MIRKIYSTHRETAHNFMWRSLQIFGKQGITFLIFILAAKLLSPYEFGVYNYVLAIVFFLIMFGDFGISTATSKYVAEYNSTNKEKLKYVLFSSGMIILILTILVSILTVIIGPWYLKDKYIYVLYILPLVFLAPMTSLYDGIYRGLKQFKKLAIISLIVGICSLSFVYILVKQYGLIGALISQNIFYLILLISMAFGYREFSLKLNKEVMKEIGKYSFIIGLGSIGLIFYTRIDTLFLGYYGYINEIAYYELANKFLMLLILPFSIVAQIISPTITEYYAKKRYNVIKIKFKKYLMISFIASLVLVFLFYFILLHFLPILLPDYYNASMINILSLLSVVYFTQLLNGAIPNGFVSATGHAKLSTYFLVIFGIIHTILNYFFINIFGYIGIVYSMILTKCTTDLLFILAYYKILSNLKE